MSEFRTAGAGFPADPPGTWVAPTEYLPPPYPAYSTYPDPGRAWTSGPPPPGTLTVATGFSFAAAGLLVLASFILLAGASVVHALAESIGNSADGGLSTRLLLAGLADLVAAGLLVAGAVLLRAGHRRGRPLIGAGTVVTAGFSIYWMAWHTSSFVVLWAVFFSGVAVVATGLAYSRPVSDWLPTRPPRPIPTQPPIPTPPNSASTPYPPFGG